MSISNLTPQQLRTAADLQEEIAALNIQLALLLDPGSAIPAPLKAMKRAKRGMSAAGKAKIRAATKLRWAKFYAAKSKLVAQSVPASKPAKRTISASHIAKIKAAQKIRWAKYNGAKAKPGAVKPVTAKPAKRGMSAAGRARIVAAQKARWAKVKAGKKAKK